ncbi:MAG: endolytic transglycosylase MltG [Chromatiaceae bacterium]|nr:endolytic transglycosylase MltG [Gammaproteobacteria bacterium]MCB1860651.1 endolytic transglycosylase MltG [Gammaproteobacteria bacterium]MCB1903160.1 endolytic transglycosylase MltG [Gammaproteobacteria bacterium]MCP5445554.1 endolytic transglycosylase MltG [Chromatiaceae bacterium]
MRHRILGVIIIIASISTAWMMMDFDNFKATPLTLPPNGITYNLEAGSTIATLAADLERKGYLEKPLYLRLLARWNKQAHRIKAGEYFIAASTTPPQLLNLLVSGRVISYSLTIVEGWDFRQMMAAVHGNDVLLHTLEGLDAAAIMQRLGYAGEHPEGRFFPDTYHFPRGTTDLQFLKRAYLAMQKMLDEKWRGRDEDLPLKSTYDALILASIIEKETGLASERPAIAGVFVRRLKKGMLLQTDPTIIYGIGESFDGNIRRADLQRDTPYNTYLHKGLTPTPICLPGAAALDAAVHPEEGKSLYFVATGDGSHQFSDTLAEHNEAVRKYQLKR